MFCGEPMLKYSLPSGPKRRPCRSWPVKLNSTQALAAVLKGNRAPFSVGNHFNEWNNNAYETALTNFVLANCGKPETQCVPFKDALAWMADSRRLLGLYGIHNPLEVLPYAKAAAARALDLAGTLLYAAGLALETSADHQLRRFRADPSRHGRGLGRNFAEFYGRSFGDMLIGNYLTEAVMPTLLHEDPRFFRMGAGPVWKRAFKAARLPAWGRPASHAARSTARPAVR